MLILSRIINESRNKTPSSKKIKPERNLDLFIFIIRETF